MRVFSPDDTDIQQVVDAAFARNGGHQPPDKGQFSSARFAFLFKPGRYPQDVPVGFYTTVHGLGDSPNDVVFDGPKGVYCEEGDYNATTGALDNFWRGAENFRSSATHAWAARVVARATGVGPACQHPPSFVATQLRTPSSSEIGEGGWGWGWGCSGVA